LLRGHCGVAGHLSSALSERVPVLVAEIDLPNDIESIVSLPKFQELQRFPSVVRDISMIVPEALSHEEIYQTMFGWEPLLAKIKFFDLRSREQVKNIGTGHKSVAYSLTYLDKNRTLTSDEVSAAHDRIRERLKNELGVELRE
jgi:phenylalanyl-tRNA synthetase beta chain